TGTYSGVMTFCYKIGQGIMTTVFTMLLGAVGFVSGQSWQSQKASDGIGWILCVGVVIFVGAGIAIFSQLKLDRKKITEIMERNNQKEQEAKARKAEEEMRQEAAASEE
ncbi:MAG: MFS transporter, partial [Clostridia bacterium]|nr:MFS transporter [Clostridia bacterium]